MHGGKAGRPPTHGRYTRAAIESLTDRAWTWFGRRHGGVLELKLGGPRAKFELNNKCVKLRSGLARLQHAPQGVDEILAGLDALIRINGASIEWGCLNSGTHDAQQDHEFDRAAVSAIVAAAMSMDRGLEALRNG